MTDISLNIIPTPEGLREKTDHFDFIKGFLQCEWHKNSITKKDEEQNLVKNTHIT